MFPMVGIIEVQAMLYVRYGHNYLLIGMVDHIIILTIISIRIRRILPLYGQLMSQRHKSKDKDINNNNYIHININTYILILLPTIKNHYILMPLLIIQHSLITILLIIMILLDFILYLLVVTNTHH